MNASSFQKAQKIVKKARIGLSGVAGSGKTLTALKLARGLGNKIALVDTENNSSVLYADRIDFDVLNLEPHRVEPRRSSPAFGPCGPRSRAMGPPALMFVHRVAIFLLSMKIRTVFGGIPALVSLLLSWLTPLSAQVYSFRSYSSKDGLVSDAVTCFAQDPRGFLWIGTTEGFSVFDGDAFRNYTLVNGLPNSYVNCIRPSRTSPGVVWIGTNGGGLSRCESGTILTIPTGESDYTHRVNAVAEDSSGKAWCGTDDGVFLVRDGKSTSFLRDSLRGYVSSLHWLGDSLLIISCQDRILWYHKRTGSLEALRLPLRPTEVAGPMTVVDGQTLWVGGSSGEIFVVRGKRLLRRIDLGGIAASSILVDEGGRILVTTPRGVLRFRPSQTKCEPFVWTTENGLPQNYVTAGFLDRESNLWFGGNSDGMSVLNTTNAVRFPIAEIGETANNACGVIDRRNHLWTMTRNGLLEVRRSGGGEWTAQRWTLPHLLSSGPPTSVAYDSARDRLWVMRLHGNLEWYSLSSLGPPPSPLHAARIFRRGIEMPPYNILRFQVLPSGRLCCAFQGLGVVLFDPYQRAHILRTYALADGIPDLDVRAILLDRRGRLWCGTYSSGLVELNIDGGASRLLRRWTVTNGLPDNSVRIIFEDSRGKVWVGTRYGGLAVIDGDSIRSYAVRDGLLSNAVWSIAEGAGGSVWVGTQTGLQSADPGTFRFTSVPELDGIDVISCGECNGQWVWTYSLTGVTVVDHPHARRNLPPPAVYITRVTVNGRDASPLRGLDLSSSESNVSVDFVGISLGYPREVQYQYKFEPVDDAWHEPTRLHSLSFAALSPGHYRLLVKALNADGVESPTPAVLQFGIAPPLWQRWWFIVLAGGGCILFAIVIVRSRLQRSLMLERLRTRIATDLHDEIGANLTRITVFADAVHHEISDRPDIARGKVGSLVAEISTISRELVDSMSDVVWSIDPRNDSFENLLLRVKSTSGRVLEAKGIEYDFNIPEQLGSLKLPLDFRRNFFLVFKEALNNVLRHSGASRVRIAVSRADQCLTLTVTDNGQGFEPGRDGGGNGLRNMRRRAENLGGRLRVESAVGEGTVVTLNAKLP